MNKKTKIDHQKLAGMMRDVIEAGRETGLIKPSYLKMMEDIIPQMQKIHARELAAVAVAAKKEAYEAVARAKAKLK
jgi:hypothetical protein